MLNVLAEHIMEDFSIDSSIKDMNFEAMIPFPQKDSVSVFIKECSFSTNNV